MWASSISEITLLTSSKYRHTSNIQQKANIYCTENKHLTCRFKLPRHCLGNLLPPPCGHGRYLYGNSVTTVISSPQNLISVPDSRTRKSVTVSGIFKAIILTTFFPDPGTPPRRDDGRRTQSLRFPGPQHHSFRSELSTRVRHARSDR